MKITIITVCYNSEKTIAKTLASVKFQKFKNIEHIIIDGLSSDSTLGIINDFSNHISMVISEKDFGIYDAMNKGLSFATGDIVAFLNSDDTYSNSDVLGDVINLFEAGDFDFVYGDIKMINKDGKLIRDWVTGVIHEDGLNGKQVPHPAFFVKTQILKNLSLPFDPAYKIAADLKQQLILINKNRIKGGYLSKPLVSMRLGGASTSNIFSYFCGWIESRRAYNDVFGSGGFFYTFKKVLLKINSIKFFNIFS